MKRVYAMALAASATTAATIAFRSDEVERKVDLCGDRIELVREELGQPKLDREPANADKPLLIAAVDKRVDGCAVMQMKGDVNDMRPIPQTTDDPKLQPAR
ncbi:hypothetical protein [Tsuneonella amylolytica]|uniref:hypothetical protein n=1 Tax=Tsuneonella amylolytica TaxID=2338327 RepID=UPI000EA8BA1C|nr:hypothetical protein [Tsuneonella amylolytica]